MVLTDQHFNVAIGGNVTGGDHREFGMASGEMTDSQFRTSALVRITDSSRTSRHVRKVPLPDSCTATNGRSLFDHHVGQHDAKIVLFPTSAGMIREQPPFISTGVRKYGPA